MIYKVLFFNILISSLRKCYVYLGAPFQTLLMRLTYILPALASYLTLSNVPGAFAQISPLPTASWYGAVEASYHQFAQPETVHTEGTYSPYLLKPVQVLVGHRFAKGYSLEVGFMRYQREAPAISDPVYKSGGDYYYYSNEAVQAFAASLLLRAPLLHPAAASRWQLDGRCGITYLMTRFTQKFYSVRAPNPRINEPTLEERRNLGDIPITTGLVASYRISPHMDLTADASAHISWVLCIARAFGTSGSPIGGGGGIGLRYNL